MDSSLASASSSSSSQPRHTWFSFPFMLPTIKNLLALIIRKRPVPNEKRQEFLPLQNEENAEFRISPFLATLAFNPYFAAMLGWFVAQVTKVFLNFFNERRWDLRHMFASDGIIPATQSALCVALPTSVAFSRGVSHSLFPVSLGFSLIVMYDTLRLRTRYAAAVYQAEVVNTLPAIEERQEQDRVGYTLLQKFVVAMVGCTIAIFFLIKLYVGY
ncbi:unnamed protein product [Lathyrus sativus]|nr:unnamed protein product [Lathyrus sativus]